jgi:uncharacterized membrane protein
MALIVVVNVILAVVVLTAIISLAAWGIRGSRAEQRERAMAIATGRSRSRFRPGHAHAQRGQGGARAGNAVRPTA